MDYIRSMFRRAPDKKWDIFTQDNAIKLAGSLMVTGWLVSKVAFRSRRWPLFVGAGYGMGATTVRYEHYVKQLIRLRSSEAMIVASQKLRDRWRRPLRQTQPRLRRAMRGDRRARWSGKVIWRRREGQSRDCRPDALRAGISQRPGGDKAARSRYQVIYASQFGTPDYIWVINSDRCAIDFSSLSKMALEHVRKLP